MDHPVWLEWGNATSNWGIYIRCYPNNSAVTPFGSHTTRGNPLPTLVQAVPLLRSTFKFAPAALKPGAALAAGTGLIGVMLG